MKVLILCMLLAVLSSCSKKNTIPSGIIGKDKMENILWDMIQADRFAAQYLVKDSLAIDLKKETFLLYDQVFQLNKVTKEEFVKSYNYYLSRPDITRVIFDSLATRANRRKDEVYKKYRQ